MNSDGPAGEQELDRVIAEYACMLDAGEIVDRQALLKEHPELADELAAHFADLDVVDTWRKDAQRDPALVDTDAYRTVKKTTPASSPRSLPSSESAMPAEQQSGEVPFGRYEVRERLGAGAMGEVYRAFDTKLQRDVALKVPKRDQNADAELMERFLEEARAAAKLHHRNLCPVYDTGTIEDCHFITMEFIQGKPLAEYIQPDRQQPQKSVAHLVRKLAIALAEAHQNDVIHRDLKPANIMVDQKNEPVIMDFGLARQIKSDGTRRTVAGAVIGTLAYMAPEQSQGETDKPSDIYSLGVIFYELLTGQLPRNLTGSFKEMALQIASADPRDPEVLRSDLDPRLRDICLKMLATRVEDRYASAEEVASALTDYVRRGISKRSEATTTGNEKAAMAELFAALPNEHASQPTRAIPMTAMRKPRADKGKRLQDLWHNIPPATRWTAICTSLASVLNLMTIVLIFSDGKVVVQVEIDRETLADGAVTLKIDEGEIEIAVLGETIKLVPGTHRFEVFRGNVRIQADEVTVAKSGKSVLRITPIDQRVAVNSASEPTPTSRPMHEQPPGLVHILEGHTDPIHCAAFSQDGRRILSGTSTGGDVRLWDVPSGALIKRFATQLKWCTSIVFLANGKQAALANSPTGNLRVLDLETGSTIRLLRGGYGMRLFLARDGNQLTGLSRGQVQTWEIDNWQTAFIAKVQSEAYVNGRAITSDAKQAVIGSKSGEIVVWTLDGELRDRRFTAHQMQIKCVDVSRDGRLVVSGDTTGSIVLSDITTGSRIHGFDGHGSAVHCVKFSPDGTTVLSCAGTATNNPKRAARSPADDYSVRLWDVETGLQLARFEGHTDTVRNVAFSPDGRFALSASWDRTVRVWRMPEEAWPSRQENVPPPTLSSFDDGYAKQHQQAWADYLNLPIRDEIDLPNRAGQSLVLIPPGEFEMGSHRTSTTEEKLFGDSAEYFADEHPQHRVRIGRAFYLGATEVTQRQWQTVMETTPWKGQPHVREGGDYPATYIAWSDAASFCKRLSDLGGRVFRLPTEAEWEYACRSGSRTAYSFGEDPSELDQYAWFDGNTHSVDQRFAHKTRMKLPNAWGLYDMHGNVREWCADWYEQDYYVRSLGLSPTGPLSGSKAGHVLRGGSWQGSARSCRSADRRGRSSSGFAYSYSGFRVVCDLDLLESERDGAR